ncbi:hypothetical protein [Echinicola sp. 20G]|uniref:DUF6933 domain-containing protein n=1 Tax=Echinicola sp. 20G TaxID=2781961 RepID=UPI0019103A9D|nr:hypothetical protein [Echinicola sp. 20G]
MANTYIYTTRKLEKWIKPLIQTLPTKEGPERLGKWNATVFYVDRKKCWLLTNAMTKYNLVMTGIKSSDLKGIEGLFKKALFEQLTYDGISLSSKRVDELIGGINFFPTDNDRSLTSFQNQRLLELDLWKEKFRKLESMPVKEINHRLNLSPFRIGKGYTATAFSNAIIEMKKALTS